MKKALFLFLIILTVSSCSNQKPVSNPKELIEADIAFSDYSAKNGYHKAFIEYADDSVVLLKPGRMPIIGKQSLIEIYQERSDSGLILTWKPEKAILAASGDLGYTYGFWTFIAQNDTSRGSYLSIWKKQADGKWKYSLDTGNDGLGGK